MEWAIFSESPGDDMEMGDKYGDSPCKDRINIWIQIYNDDDSYNSPIFIDDFHIR